VRKKRKRSVYVSFLKKKESIQIRLSKKETGGNEFIAKKGKLVVVGLFTDLGTSEGSLISGGG